MAIIEPGKTSGGFWILVGPRGRPARSRAASLALAAALASGCFGPPQMGPDREAFRAIDALYTAVSLREPGQLRRCAGALTALRDAGRLPSGAHESLAGIIDEAEGGGWDSAQARLREFMIGQRR